MFSILRYFHERHVHTSITSELKVFMLLSCFVFFTFIWFYIILIQLEKNVFSGQSEHILTHGAAI